MTEPPVFKIPTTCVECGCIGEELRDRPTAIIHKTIICATCKEKIDHDDTQRDQSKKVSDPNHRV